jgi:hypothetical protein
LSVAEIEFAEQKRAVEMWMFPKRRVGSFKKRTESLAHHSDSACTRRGGSKDI